MVGGGEDVGDGEDTGEGVGEWEAAGEVADGGEVAEGEHGGACGDRVLGFGVGSFGSIHLNLVVLLCEGGVKYDVRERRKEGLKIWNWNGNKGKG